MTIKRRFITSYLSAIAISVISIFFILSIVLYVTIGKVPSIVDVYKMLTTQRSLTSAEEKAYIELDTLLKKSPERMKLQNNKELLDIITDIEASGLNVALKENNEFTYFSEDLVEKSLIVHAIDYELNNLKPVGTLDNAGRLYHYLKKDFNYLDGAKGSFIILKRESTLLEFFTKWGVWVILVIILLTVILFIYINRQLTKTTIQPIEKLQKATKTIENSTDLSEIVAFNPQENISKEIYDLEKSFRDMWHKLNESENLKMEYEKNRKELIANISHDLKTPITSIIGYVEGLQDGVANTEEKRAAYLQVIHEKALNLNQLIEELFLYSKLEMEEQSFVFEKIDYQLFVKHIYDHYQLIHPNIIWHFDSNLTGDEVLIDVIQMERVITNILENSIKFNQTAEKILNIDFKLVREGDQINLTIKDDGIGISKEDLPFVFDRFYRSDKSRTPSVKGTGLGLSIVKQIMEKHHGDCFVASEKGEGTSMLLTLPTFKKEGGKI